MKLIKIRSKKHPNLYVKVSDCDFDYLNQLKWSPWYDKKGYFRFMSTQGSMSKLIMKPPKGMVVDHINHDTLDNRRENLRVCTLSQNMMNSKKHTRNKSGFKGVYGFLAYGKYHYWCTHIYVNGKKKWLGSFKSVYDAAFARKEAEAKYHGEYAYRNL